MIWPLFKKELWASRKILLMFMALLSIYGVVIVALYDPALGSVLDMMAATMPEVFAAFNMTTMGANILEFVANYLYGFILLVIPMIYILIMTHRLMGRYLDKGSMAYLLSTPYNRRQVLLTQWVVLISGLSLLLGYFSGLLVACMTVFVNESFNLGSFVLLNLGLFAQHFMIASGCFLSSCSFNEAKMSVGVGAGACIVFVLMQMLSGVSDKIAFLKYLNPLSLFNSQGLIDGNILAILGMLVLIGAGIGLLYLAMQYFEKRDLPL